MEAFIQLIFYLVYYTVKIIFLILSWATLARPLAYIHMKAWLNNYPKGTNQHLFLQYIPRLIYLIYLQIPIIFLINKYNLIWQLYTSTDPIKLRMFLYLHRFIKLLPVYIPLETYVNKFPFYSPVEYWHLFSGVFAVIPFVIYSVVYYRQFKDKTMIDKELEDYYEEVYVPKQKKLFKKFTKLFNKIKKYRAPLTIIGWHTKGRDFALLSDEERFMHTSVIGGTGAGKTHSVLFPILSQDISKRRGVIFVDAKGDLTNAKTIYQMCKDSGRENDFKMFSIANPGLSNTYNPLELGNATELKDKIMSCIEITEPHYKLFCENALQTFFFEHLKKKKPLNFNVLFDKFNNPVPDEYPKYYDFYKNNKAKIERITNELATVVNTEFGHLFKGNDINLMDVYLNKKVVYISLPITSNRATATRLGHIITNDINCLCGNAYKIEKNIRKELSVFIDEYNTFGTPAFADTLAQARESGFMITIAYQSLGRLADISPSHPDQINTNTNTKFILQGASSDATEAFVKDVGTYKTVKSTEQIIMQNEEERTSTKTASLRSVDEFKIHPQKVRDVRKGFGYFKSLSNFGLLHFLPVIFNTENIHLPDLKKKENSEEDKKQESKWDLPKSAEDI
ncbi:MAG: type IV secretory system conjugative DNA transfer family protein [Endomicrobiales bacterium]|nr:type IV secretory system conjugative DNA transfer family protein [Endomicrobiales bacterium]